MLYQQKLRFSTRGRGTYDISSQVEDCVAKSAIQTGICQLFIQHTSASIILCENADETVREDLDRFMAKLIPDGSPLFEHMNEGPDDMPAHVRTTLTQSSISIPVSKGRCELGTWQGVYLWEHRTNCHKRNIIVTVMGE